LENVLQENISVYFLISCLIVRPVLSLSLFVRINENCTVKKYFHDLYTFDHIFSFVKSTSIIYVAQIT